MLDRYKQRVRRGEIEESICALIGAVEHSDQEIGDYLRGLVEAKVEEILNKEVISPLALDYFLEFCRAMVFTDVKFDLKQITKNRFMEL